MHNNPFSHSAGAALTRGSSYLRQFIADPRTTGALLPSSAALCRAMMNQVDWGVSLSIAELGAANGVLTKGSCRGCAAMRCSMPMKLIRDSSASYRTIDDRRLNVVAASAERLINPYDIVFSCLPLLSLPLRISMRILNQIRQQMSAHGLFIQFQYSPLSETLLSRYFRWQRIVVMRNLPPALVYVCTLR
jgi:phospholipid N-methyltransferase